MGDVQTTRTTSVDRFWERFIDLARKNGVKDTAVRWYVRHAERYLEALSGKRLAEHTREDVTGYLESVGRIDGIEDWRFRQIVDAIQMLLSTANAKVVGEVDWVYWRDSDRTLAPDHPTIARETAARRVGEADEEPVSGARFKEKRNPPSALDEVRRSHPRLLEQLDGMAHLMAALLYGTGMRLMECVRLRVQDVDFQ
jgi:integrase